MSTLSDLRSELEEIKAAVPTSVSFVPGQAPHLAEDFKNRTIRHYELYFRILILSSQQDDEKVAEDAAVVLKFLSAATFGDELPYARTFLKSALEILIRKNELIPLFEAMHKQGILEPVIALARDKKSAINHDMLLRMEKWLARQEISEPALQNSADQNTGHAPTELARLRARLEEVYTVNSGRINALLAATDDKTRLRLTAELKSPKLETRKLLIKIIIEGYRQNDHSIAEECQGLIANITPAGHNSRQLRALLKNEFKNVFAGFTKAQLNDLFSAMEEHGLLMDMMYDGKVYAHRNGSGSYFVPSTWEGTRHAEAMLIPAEKLMPQHEQMVIPMSVRHAFYEWNKNKTASQNRADQSEVITEVDTAKTNAPEKPEFPGSPALKKLRDEFQNFSYQPIPKLSLTNAIPGGGFKEPKDVQELLKAAYKVIFLPIKILILAHRENDEFTFMDAKHVFDFFTTKLEGQTGQSHRKFIKQSLEHLSRQERDQLYDALNHHGYLNLIITGSKILEPSIPLSFRNEIEKWLKKNTQLSSDDVKIQIGNNGSHFENADIGSDDDNFAIELPDVSVPELPEEIETVPETLDCLAVVEVDHHLIIDGDAAEIGPTLRRKRKDPDEQIPVRIQPRIDWITDALKENGFQLRDMILFREKEEELAFADAFDEEAYKRSRYRILEISKDHHYFQIAVAETVGKSTYVIREPIEFKDGDVIEASLLKKRADVFQISCYSKQQLVRQIKKCALTPFDELQEQLKTRIGWGDKKEAVIQILGYHYIETGCLPPTIGQSIIDLGPHYKPALTCPEDNEVLTTWRRVYGALHGEAIAGLEGIKTFHALLEHIGLAEEGEKPAPKLPFDAVQVFKNAAHHIQAHAAFPEDLDLSERLENRIVSGMEDVITGDISDIGTTGDFLVAAGLAVRDAEQNILTAPPPVIRQMVRFANLLVPAA